MRAEALGPVRQVEVEPPGEHDEGLVGVLVLVLDEVALYALVRTFD